MVKVFIRDNTGSLGCFKRIDFQIFRHISVEGEDDGAVAFFRIFHRPFDVHSAADELQAEIVGLEPWAEVEWREFWIEVTVDRGIQTDGD